MNISEWISVKDRLPKHGIDVLVYPIKNRFGSEPVYTAHRMQWEEHRDTWEYIWAGSIYSISLDFITHWMPLPKPPKKDE